MDRADVIRELFARRGHSEYGGEAVTQLAHALQSAFLAETANAPPALIVAALLHDLGHLLHDLPDDAPDRGIDDRHEVCGQRFLAKYFAADVTDPVRLHVAAKRYLCSVDDNYLRGLSQPSLISYELQGGRMTPEELAAFRQEPHFAAAIDLRRWDDQAKVPGLATPDLEHFLCCLERCLEPMLDENPG